MPGIRLLVLLLLLPLPAAAQVFWTVETPDGETSWLLGTVHSEDPRLLDFPPELVEAMQAANTFAMELVPDASVLEQLSEAMHYARDDRLDNHLDEALYAEVVRILDESYGMGEPAVRRMRPWAVAMTLSVPPPQTGFFMDLALSFRAAGLGLDVTALEKLEEQLDFLRGMSHDMQVEMIRQAVDEHDRMPELFEKLISAYMEGDLDGLESLAGEQLEDLSPELRTHFVDIGIDQRNAMMLERAMPMVARGGVLIAVGALHLPGESGLIQGFRRHGLTVTPVY